MKIQEFDGFIDVCCEADGMNELEIEARLRKILPERGYSISSERAGRVGNPGPGAIFRFKLTEA